MKKFLMLAALVGGTTLFGATQTAKADHFYRGYGPGYGYGYGAGCNHRGYGSVGYGRPGLAYPGYYGGYSNLGYGGPVMSGPYGSGFNIGFGNGRSGLSIWNW